MPSDTLRILQVIKHALNGWKIVWISMVCWKIHHFNQFRSMIFREIIRNLHVVRGFPIAAMITRGCHGEPRPTDRCLNMIKQKLHIDLYIFNHIYTMCTCANMKKNQHLSLTSHVMHVFVFLCTYAFKRLPLIYHWEFSFGKCTCEERIK